MKQIKTFALLALVALLGIAMTACNGNGYNNKEARELVKKARKDKLKKADYAKILDWYEAATEEFTDQYEKVIKENEDFDDFSIAATEFSARFTGKYPLLNTLFDALNSASEDDMGSANYAKYLKLREKFEKKMEKLNEKAPKPDEDDGGIFGGRIGEADSMAIDEEAVVEEVYEEPVPAEVYEEVADSAVEYK